jgi:UDP-3-O-acyl N-acetylglucosamine deacetylase
MVAAHCSEPLSPSEPCCEEKLLSDVGAVPIHVVSWRRQRTLAKPIKLTARGLLYGRNVNLMLTPAPPNTGRFFRRADLPDTPLIPAVADRVSSTQRRTVLGTAPAHVELVEHVLAALAALMVDNCILEIDRPELPGWDGSVLPLAHALSETGIVEQEAWIPVITPQRPLIIRHHQASVAIYPNKRPELHISYFLDYGHWAVIAPQRFGCCVTPETFLNSIAGSRTFLLLEEVQALRRQGVGIETGPEQVLVFTPQGVLANRLRWADEPARHKTLDLLGDLSLVGLPLAGHVFACRSGHTLNVALAKCLRRSLISSGILNTNSHLCQSSAA